jgi:hypothetical protein
MASSARKAFDKNCADIDQLLDLHKSIAGKGPGRKYQVEVLNKASIVLITSFWEAYCEDIAAEALQFLVKHSPDSSALPKELRKQVAKELRGDLDDLAMWKLSGDGWRPVLEGRLADLQTERNRRLNTPKTAQIDDLFVRAVGIPKMSSRWFWQGMSSSQATTKLDKYVELRGAIAHRGAASTAVRKNQVTDYYELIKRLVGKTGGRVNTEVKKATGKPLW